jgi:hypothetical protein
MRLVGQDLQSSDLPYVAREPVGARNTKNDIVYQIHFTVTDAAGNVGRGVCPATVPHDQAHSAVDSGVHYTVGTCS